MDLIQMGVIKTEEVMEIIMAVAMVMGTMVTGITVMGITVMVIMVI